MKVASVFESDPVVRLETSEYGKMIKEMQFNLDTTKGEMYELLSKNKKKAIPTSRKCLHNIRMIAFRFRKMLMAHQKSMPIRKLTKKAKK